MSVLIKYFKNIFRKKIGSYTTEVFDNYAKISELSTEINDLIYPFLNGIKLSEKYLYISKNTFKANELADYIQRQTKELNNIFETTFDENIVENDTIPLQTKNLIKTQENLINYLKLIKKELIELIKLCTISNNFNQKILNLKLSELYDTLNNYIEKKLLSNFFEIRTKIIKKSIEFENKILKNKRRINLLIKGKSKNKNRKIANLYYYYQEENDNLIYLSYLLYVKKSQIDRSKIRSYFENRKHYDSIIPFNHYNLPLKIDDKEFNIHIIPIESKKNVENYFKVNEIKKAA